MHKALFGSAPPRYGDDSKERLSFDTRSHLVGFAQVVVIKGTEPRQGRDQTIERVCHGFRKTAPRLAANGRTERKPTPFDRGPAAIGGLSAILHTHEGEGSSPSAPTM